ncbi:hypothetical protein OG413_01700 [Streptomyces sp. NBC_01433]|uniref:hypothetical protein n=1 Tax=Streptomyces sp. NBC_01433 TaxID=2903864 RepID=UPI00224D6E1F|nr:hypothetical protein [Streptomyces sp. NBC_01433]MCX4674044.1 hypothetical protein [Streptomyces sp. NBC_01433]
MNEVVLRRVSWMVICWIIILGTGITMLAAVHKVTSVNGFRTGWQGIPVFMLLAGFIGRIVNCKVILRGGLLTVVNPLRSHILPVSAIHDVAVSDDGTLEVELDRDRVVSVYAFGGSLIDHFKGSSKETARTISAWLGSARVGSESKADTPQIRWTRCPSADASLALGVVLAAVGAIWMAFTGS